MAGIPNRTTTFLLDQLMQGASQITVILSLWLGYGVFSGPCVIPIDPLCEIFIYIDPRLAPRVTFGVCSFLPPPLHRY